MADGVGSSSIASIFEDQVGELCVSSLFTDIVLSRFDGRHFLAEAQIAQALRLLRLRLAPAFHAGTYGDVFTLELAEGSTGSN